MRTKALLLAAAFAAAGVSLQAQTYSVNAVGYINVALTPGFNLVANQLDAGAGNNTVGKLFTNIQGGAPGGMRVFVFNPTTGGFSSALWTGASFNPPAFADTVVNVGEGAFIQIPTAAGNKTLTLVGEVKQGTLNNPLPVGFSIKSNMVPQEGKPDAFGLTAGAGDRIFKFNKSTGAYSSSLNVGGSNWVPPTPSIAVGEAFFYFRAAANGAGTWTRSFNVNNPA